MSLSRMPSDHELSFRCLMTRAIEPNGSQVTDSDLCECSMGHRGSSLVKDDNEQSVDHKTKSTVTPSYCLSPTVNDDMTTSIHHNWLKRQTVTPRSNVKMDETTVLDQQGNGYEDLSTPRAPPTPPPWPPVMESKKSFFKIGRESSKKDKDKLLTIPDRPDFDQPPKFLREWVPPVMGPPTVPCGWFVVGVLPEVDSRSRFVARIVHVSDTHDSHDQITIPDGDVLIHSGDFFTWHGSKVFEKDALVLDKFFAKQHHKHKIFVAGNHEMSFRNHSPEKIQQHLPHAVYLHDSETTVTGGLRVYGAPWTIERYTPATAFQDNPYKTGKHWEKVPEGIDILVTHSPPKHLLDDEGKCGCPTLREHVLKRIRPRMHLFGHAHHNATAIFYDGILFSNGTVGERALGKSVPAVIDVYLPPSANDE